MRSDIIFVVGQLSKHNTNLRKGYLQAVKKVVKYLKGILDISLIFDRETVNYLLREPPLYNSVGYIDSNFIGDPKD